MARALFVSLIFCNTFCFSQERILFVGNERITFDNLPLLVEKMARYDGKKLKTDVIASEYHYSLEDHWNDGLVLRQLKKRKYDMVIFQAGASSTEYTRPDLIKYAMKFSEACKEAQIPMGLLMVWPIKDNFDDFEKVITSYTLAADTTGSVLFPAGKAWYEILKNNRKFLLHHADGYNAAVRGNILNAMIIYRKLQPAFNFDKIVLKELTDFNITQEQFAIMKVAALHALQE